MMWRIEKTVFISYRHTNFWTALAVFQNLHSNGYDVFFDYKNIPSGDFEQVITENVKSRAHFIVILSPSALERCNEPGDWLRREIETAIESKRNIIPLIMEGFDFGSPTIVNALTGKLADLKKYNAMGIPAEYFDDAMVKLRGERFLNRPLESIFHPVSNTTKQITAEQKLAANKAAPVLQEQLTAQEWFERGYFFNESRKYDDSIRCYTEALLFEPNSAEAFSNRGLAFSAKGDLENAMKDFENAIRINPKDSDYFGNIGFAILENNGNLDQALKSLDTAIKLNPNNAIHYNNRGRVYYRKQEYSKAIADFDTAIKQNPNYVHPYFNRANVRRAHNDVDGAISDYDQAIRLKVNDASAFHNRGVLRQTKGDFSNALKDLNEAVKMAPNDVVSRMSQFSILMKLQRYSEAKAQEKIVRELIQKESEYNQACFEAICGNKEKAFELLKIALEKKIATKEWILQDPDFENIRDDPRFKELVRE